ncbi:MAG: flagellar motor protein MotD [Nevskiaceae bacterium]|nr:MAG: flagellar motor protein MotD [Nevskiaceae bacterium]TAM23092.1 MAG: flagellar motor protein MotD [Nevskiaceae bacterium]
MARKHKHEEHLNAEAWAIPYGDLVTLLLALFVVMYAMSSVNEGKYRVLSESLNEAFHGTPRVARPIQVGEQSSHGIGGAPAPSPSRPRREPGGTGMPDNLHGLGAVLPSPGVPLPVKERVDEAGRRDALRRIAREVEAALGDLISKDVVIVRHKENRLEIEIKTDILFASGVAAIAEPARPVLVKLGGILAQFPNRIRVEGHTDDMPIATAAFPSNWELSAARATSVVHVLIGAGLLPARLSVAGYGEFQPAVANDSVEHRNRNRRVVLVVLASEDGVDPLSAPGMETGALAPEPEQTRTDAQAQAVTAAATPTSSEAAEPNSDEVRAAGAAGRLGDHAVAAP